MEGTLPGIGLMLETPAALKNPADLSSSPSPFAALLGEGAGEPAGAPAGSALPPTGPVLPPSAPLFKAVAGTGEPVPSAAVSATPGDSLIPALPGATPAVAGEPGLPASNIHAALQSGSGIVRMPGADEQSVALTEQVSLSDVTTDRNPAAATAEVVEMVRHLGHDFAGHADTGMRGVATASSQVMRPEPAPSDPATHPALARLPERPSQIVAQSVSVAPGVDGDPVVPPQSLATASRTVLTPEPAIQAGIVNALTRQVAPDAAAASPDGSELPDLPFESIRVMVREAGGERPLPNREPAFQLPGPRQPLGDPQWARSLGERLAVVVRGEHQTARMSLNPAHLGPIDIQLRLQDDQAQLWLTAQHPQAREALESAMPRLREMFAQQGIDLSQQGNSGQSGEQGPDERTARLTGEAASGSGGDESESGFASGSRTAHGRRDGLFDAYA
ncbi:MAG: flagellar hook-length control protein FliK [Gammaproteobacteria bacterium]|jgi:hypothetical protein